MGTTIAPPSKPPSHWIKRALSDRVVWIGLAVWIVFSATIPYLSQGIVPFNQPALAALPYGARVMIEVLGPIVAFLTIGVVYALTRRRFVDIAARAPERAIALRETLDLLVYGAVALIGGVFVGRLAGAHRIGLHLTGSMFGMIDSVSPREVWVWSLYNFTFYAAIPYLWFRRRGYSREQLCLKSSNPLNDTIVILVILAIGLAFDLPGNPILKLSGSQFAGGAALAFFYSFLGTGLPIMIFLTSILVPRYRKITGSTAATVVLGGFTYAAMHLTEYWTRYDTPSHSALSVIFIVLFFGGPGMVKAYLTLRTGNAWVHLWGYHVIWPHVSGDTPLFVKIFNLR
jgi:hypothetical protein